MELGRALLAVGAGDRAASFEMFSETLEPAWIEAALHATDRATVRKRKLPAVFVVWLVIGMALLRDRSIREVVRHLDLVLPTGRRRTSVSGSAIAAARARLGPEPLAALFAQATGVWGPVAADATRWRGLAVYGVDGSTLCTPDTVENGQAFGRPTNAGGGAAYPQLRLVVLMVLRSHLWANFAAGPYTTGETTLAQKLWDDLPDDALVVLDKGYINYALFWQIQNGGCSRSILMVAADGTFTT